MFFALDCSPGFCVVAFFGSPSIIEVLRVGACCFEDCAGSVDAPVSPAFEASPLLASCSNGEPLSIDPSGIGSPFGAALSEAAATSPVSEGDIAAALSSALDFGSSGLAFGGTLSIMFGLSGAVLSFFSGELFGVVCSVMFPSFSVDFWGFRSPPLVFGFPSSPFVIKSPAPSPFITCPLLPNSSGPSRSPICPLGSTEMKLVRTLEIG